MSTQSGSYKYNVPTIDSDDSPNWESEDNDSVDLGMTKTLVEKGDEEDAPGKSFMKAVKKSLLSRQTKEFNDIVRDSIPNRTPFIQSSGERVTPVGEIFQQKKNLHRKYNTAWYLPPKYWNKKQTFLQDENRYDMERSRNAYMHLHARKDRTNPYTDRIEEASELDQKFKVLQNELLKLPAIKGYKQYLMNNPAKRVPGCLQQVSIEDKVEEQQVKKKNKN